MGNFMVMVDFRRSFELPASGPGVRLRGVLSSDRAELSTLRSQLEELTERVVAVASRYGDTSDSAVAADLYSAERSLFGARRALDRAIAALEE
jgi:hypothetical protein